MSFNTDPSNPAFDPNTWEYVPYIERLDYKAYIARVIALQKFAGVHRRTDIVSTPHFSLRYNWFPFDAQARGEIRAEFGASAFSHRAEWELDDNELDLGDETLPAGVPALVTLRLPVNDLTQWDRKRVGAAMERALRRALVHRPTREEAPEMVASGPPTLPGVPLEVFSPDCCGAATAVRVEWNWTPFARGDSTGATRDVTGDVAGVTFRVPVTDLPSRAIPQLVRTLQKALAVFLEHRPTRAEVSDLLESIPSGPRNSRRHLVHGAEAKLVAFARDLERLGLYARFLMNFREIAYLERQRERGKPVSVYALPRKIRQRQPGEAGVADAIKRSYAASFERPMPPTRNSPDRWVLPYDCPDHGPACPPPSSSSSLAHTPRPEDSAPEASPRGNGHCRFLDHWYARAKRVLVPSQPRGEVLLAPALIEAGVGVVMPDWAYLDNLSLKPVNADTAAPVMAEGEHLDWQRLHVDEGPTLPPEEMDGEEEDGQLDEETDPEDPAEGTVRRPTYGPFRRLFHARADWSEIHSAQVMARWAWESEDRRLDDLKKRNPQIWADLVLARDQEEFFAIQHASWAGQGHHRSHQDCQGA